jgi:hypothetical protein
MGGEQGDLFVGSTWHKRGPLEFSGYVQAEGSHRKVL